MKKLRSDGARTRAKIKETLTRLAVDKPDGVHVVDIAQALGMHRLGVRPHLLALQEAGLAKFTPHHAHNRNWWIPVDQPEQAQQG